MGLLAVLRKAGRTREVLGAPGCSQAPSPPAISVPPRCGPTEPFGALWLAPPFGCARKVRWGRPGQPHGAACCRRVSVSPRQLEPVGRVHTCAAWRVLAGSWGPQSGLLLGPGLRRRLLMAAGQRWLGRRCASLVGPGSWGRVDALASGGCWWPARPGRCWRRLRMAHRRVSVVFSGSAGSGISLLTWLQVVGMVSGALSQHPMGQLFAHGVKDPQPFRTQVLTFDFGKNISHSPAHVQVIIKPQRR